MRTDSRSAGCGKRARTREASMAIRGATYAAKEPPLSASGNAAPAGVAKVRSRARARPTALKEPNMKQGNLLLALVLFALFWLARRLVHGWRFGWFFGWCVAGETTS